MDKSTIKKSLIGLGLVSVASIASNFYLINQVNTLKDQMLVESDVAKLKDDILALQNDEWQPAQNTQVNADQLNQFLMDNPMSIVKSLAKYRFEQEQLAAQQEAENVKKQMESLIADVNDPFIGNPNGTQVIVEFVDYNCGYCKRLSPILEEVVSLNPEAKIIVKEFPIFQNQPTSDYSAQMATAMFYYNPEKYAEFHNLLMGTTLSSKAVVDTLIAKIGVEKDRLNPYLEKAKRQVEKTRTLGAQLQVNGTPTVFFNGERISTGYTAEEFIAVMAQ
ncbi:thioredoxin domain-containing protein [Vibrio aestuarianus subsp. cardii]|uniref:DsbA family protein n=1 Tax=Vibrio aestuarianus TaxID=28171 RepID=UPI0015583567|nr:DsbA family protein [Vibrio aestuarianus]NGZ66654.1 thioredoxin domain-containing protein [Vibrio aestuarianus subsp. cardii]